MKNRHTILVVDDDPGNIRIITAALKDEYDIISALNGHDAINRFKEHTPAQNGEYRITINDV